MKIELTEDQASEYQEETYHDICLDCGHAGTNFDGRITGKMHLIIICPKCRSENTEPLKSFWGTNKSEPCT